MQVMYSGRPKEPALWCPECGIDGRCDLVRRKEPYYKCRNCESHWTANSLETWLASFSGPINRAIGRLNGIAGR